MLHKALVDSLPDMNLGNDEEEEEDDVVPLDFRTALMQDKIIIQAKPLEFKEDDYFLTEESAKNTNVDKMDLDSYLEAVKK